MRLTRGFREADNVDVAVRSPIASSENFCTRHNILVSDVLNPHMIQLGHIAVGTKDNAKITVIAQEAPKYIPKPRTTLFQGRENDEPRAPQNTSTENSSPILNVVIGLKFRAIIFMRNIASERIKMSKRGVCIGLI